MFLIHNQIFIEEKRAYIFKKTSLSRGRSRGWRRVRRGRSFPNHAECAEPAERRAINFLPPPESFRFLFPRDVFARTFGELEKRASVKARTMRDPREYVSGAERRRKGRTIVPRDCGGHLSGIKGIKERRTSLSSEWRYVESLTQAFRPPYPRVFLRFILRPLSRIRMIVRGVRVCTSAYKSAQLAADTRKRSDNKNV